MRTRIATCVLALALAAACVAGGCAHELSGAGRQAAYGATVVESVVAKVMDCAAEAAPLQFTTASPYAYSTLDAGDRERYLAVLDAFASREARDYPDDDMDRLTRVRDCVLADHPELFALQSIHTETTTNSLTGEVTRVQVSGGFSHSPEEADAVLQASRAAAEDCFAGLTAAASDYAIAKRAYEYLVEHVEYQPGGSEAHAPEQTIEGALVNGRAVCGGYANAFAYLLQSVGVQCAVVPGIADGTEHAWCVAKLDGEYYYVDPTWGDPVDGSLNYDYLGITTADLEQEHSATSAYPLPRCAATADNYYVREGLVLDWPDEERFAELVATGVEQVRCADLDTYASLLDFVSSGRLANRLAVSQYRYASSDALLTLKVYLA